MFKILPNSFRFGWIIFLHVLAQFHIFYPTSAAEDESISSGMEAPQKGETLTLGTKYTIKWTNFEEHDDGHEHTVGLYLQRMDLGNPGLPIKSINQAASNTGSYVWEIPNDQPEGYYQILAIDMGILAASGAIVLQRAPPSKPDDTGETLFEASVPNSAEIRTFKEYDILRNKKPAGGDITETTTRVSSTIILAVTATETDSSRLTPLQIPPTMLTQVSPAERPSTALVATPWPSDSVHSSGSGKAYPSQDKENSSYMGTIAYFSSEALAVIIPSFASIIAGAAFWIYVIYMKKKQSDLETNALTDSDSDCQKPGEQKSWWNVRSGRSKPKKKAREDDITPTQAKIEMEAVSEDAEYFPKTRVIV